jgi:hypothetical protein
VIVSHIDRPSRLAVSDTDIFWTTPESAPPPSGPVLMRAPLAGGPATGVVVRVPPPETPAALTGNLTAADGNVYFQAPDLMSAQQSGGEVTMVAAGNIGGSAASSTWLYWMDIGALEIRGQPLAGGSPVTLAATACPSPEQCKMENFGLTESRMFWTELHFDDNPAGGNLWEEIHVVPTAGGSNSLLVKEKGPYIYAIAANESNLYWKGPLGIQTMPAAGGVATTLSDDGDVMVADASGLYVLASGPYTGQPPGPDWASWSVLEFPISGGMKILASGMAQGDDRPGIAVDDECVYWSEATSDGTISAVAK